MNGQPPASQRVNLPRDPFGYIAFWQLMTFLILLLLIWINEFRDLTSFFFQTSPEGVNYFRAALLSAAVCLTAVITIGNTYLQQKRVLNALVSVCSKCYRVQVRNNIWEKMEEYLSHNTLLSFTHGLCPQCLDEALHDIEQRKLRLQQGRLPPAPAAP